MDSSYDIFISYNHDNEKWVREWLLPHLEDHGVSVCIDSRDFEPGLPVLRNIELAIQRSTKTILVITPAWLESEWTKFESLLVQTNDPSGHHQKLVPIMLKDCELPDRLQMLTYADFRDEDRWQFELNRVVGVVETEQTVQSQDAAEGDESTSDPFAESRVDAYQIGLTHLLSLQYPWGEWSDRRTSLESKMGQRQEIRGVEGPKPNVARTIFALEALDTLGDSVTEVRENALDWIRGNIENGWYKQWSLGGTPDSEMVLPNLFQRSDIRHSAECVSAFSTWGTERDPLAKLTENVGDAALPSGFWPESPGDSEPRLLGTVYAVEGLGKVIYDEFRLGLPDLIPDEAVQTVQSAFRRGVVALEEDCNDGGGLVGEIVGDPSPYLTGIALFRLAPLAKRDDGIERLVGKFVDGLLDVRNHQGVWQNTAVSPELQSETVQRTTLRISAGLARARRAGMFEDEEVWQEITQIVTEYAAGQEVLELDSPDHACLMITLQDDIDVTGLVNVAELQDRAAEMQRDYVDHWRKNFEEYYSRLERGRKYNVTGYEELSNSLDAKISRFDHQ